VRNESIYKSQKYSIYTIYYTLSIVTMAQFGNTRGRGGGRGGRGGGRGGRGGGSNGPKLPAELRDKVDQTYGKSGNKKDRDFRRRNDGPDSGPSRDKDRGYEQSQRRESNRSERPRQEAGESSRAGPSRERSPPPTKTKSTTSNPTAQSGKKAKEVVDDAPPKKKKKELRLPNARTDDAEDGEIEWLEYTLRNEKGKEEESDGLDGECTLALE
jgi:hypothetical protein